jgi:drug/metabolite transporter (DMT)-like permease
MPAARFAFPAMLAGSICLAFGPWLVRLADVAPVASAFWRVALAVVPLALLAGMKRGPLKGLSWGVAGGVALAALCFAGDLAVWHLGIARTTLANAALLSNAASFLLPLFGYLASRTLPGRYATLALVCAAAGTALLLGRSADVSARHLAGDLLCLGAAVLYTGYLIFAERARRSLAPFAMLALSTVIAAAALLPVALVTEGPFWPRDWTPLVLLALGSQVTGQGLLIYAVAHLKPIVVGLTLLVQPAIAGIIGAYRFGEVPGIAEIGGAALVIAALLLVRLPEPVKTSASAR